MYIFVNNLNVAVKKSLPKSIFLVVCDSSLKEPSSERILLLLFVSLQWWCGVIIFMPSPKMLSYPMQSHYQKYSIKLCKYFL
jgi:hypothetical protein